MIHQKSSLQSLVCKEKPQPPPPHQANLYELTNIQCQWATITSSIQWNYSSVFCHLTCFPLNLSWCTGDALTSQAFCLWWWLLPDPVPAIWPSHIADVTYILWLEKRIFCNCRLTITQYSHYLLGMGKTYCFVLVIWPSQITCDPFWLGKREYSVPVFWVSHFTQLIINEEERIYVIWPQQFPYEEAVLGIWPSQYLLLIRALQKLENSVPNILPS